MIPEKLEQESKKLKDAIVRAINQFKYETNLMPMVDIKIIEETISCSIMTTIDVTVKVQI